MQGARDELHRRRVLELLVLTLPRGLFRFLGEFSAQGFRFCGIPGFPFGCGILLRRAFGLRPHDWPGEDHQRQQGEQKESAACLHRPPAGAWALEGCRTVRIISAASRPTSACKPVCATSLSLAISALACCT